LLALDDECSLCDDGCGGATSSSDELVMMAACFFLLFEPPAFSFSSSVSEPVSSSSSKSSPSPRCFFVFSARFCFSLLNLASSASCWRLAAASRYFNAADDLLAWTLSYMEK